MTHALIVNGASLTVLGVALRGATAQMEHIP
jgi:hypothetical protein